MNQILYDELLRLARLERLSTYSDVAPLINLSMDSTHGRNEMTRLLEEIAVHENNAGRPMLTALIVHRGNDNNPGEGFFFVAQNFGLFNGTHDALERLIFWMSQVKRVHDHWVNN